MVPLLWICSAIIRRIPVRSETNRKEKAALDGSPSFVERRLVAVADEATIALTPAQERECGGRVVGVSLVVGEDGSLTSRRVISSASAVCDAIALEAVARNRYKPALDERGRPVEGRFLLSIRF